MDQMCGPLTFISNFDSGNLARAAYVEATDDSSDQTKNGKDDVQQKMFCDYEFNVWTKPDCMGTEFENGNRTWFHFGVKDGPIGKVIRINVMNLNKQSRLYSQGMVPACKVSSGGRDTSWERLKTRVTYQAVEGNFILSFSYKLPETKTATVYFAFCFPFSYTECQTMLNMIEGKYSFPPSAKPLDGMIYFHRELLCYSLEKRRVELLTISSYAGISNSREDKLHGLFPDGACDRARKFIGKKVYFLTARVHPGETPSSFVFNGFLNFILNEKDPRAYLLRQLFVFKLVPMINPDGVYNGFYRTDTRGVNLNRVYLNPNPELHPSVYAIRNLILYHHEKGDENLIVDDRNLDKSYPSNEINSTLEKPKNDYEYGAFVGRPIEKFSNGKSKVFNELSERNEIVNNLRERSDVDGPQDQQSNKEVNSGNEALDIFLVKSKNLREKTGKTTINGDESKCKVVNENCIGDGSHFTSSIDAGFNATRIIPQATCKECFEVDASCCSNVYRRKYALDDDGCRALQNQNRFGKDKSENSNSFTAETANNKLLDEGCQVKNPSSYDGNACKVPRQEFTVTESNSVHSFECSNELLEEPLQIKQAIEDLIVDDDRNQLHQLPTSELNHLIAIPVSLNPICQREFHADSFDSKDVAFVGHCNLGSTELWRPKSVLDNNIVAEINYKANKYTANCIDGQHGEGVTLSLEYNGYMGLHKQENHVFDLVKSKKKTTDSNIAYYIDLHGHASKRGCFIYANHMENFEDQIEALLFPKLMSINSQNFDFEACNFSLKNMTHKDKRDGMSKEGSGRVAIYKTTGVVHSYTLECNYNTGRFINPLPAASNGDGRATPPMSLSFPPKYTPDVFAQVGRALAITALDMLGVNPWSRIPATEFHTLKSIRQWLSVYIRSTSNPLEVKRKNGKSKTKEEMPFRGSQIKKGEPFRIGKKSQTTLEKKSVTLVEHRMRDLSLESVTTKGKQISFIETKIVNERKRAKRPIVDLTVSRSGNRTSQGKTERSESLPVLGLQDKPIEGVAPKEKTTLTEDTHLKKDLSKICKLKTLPKSVGKPIKKSLKKNLTLFESEDLKKKQSRCEKTRL